ncbi:sugar transporter, partial [Salmonella enterica subsp. enterica serovar Anatum]|nr:sugar transporter [Salmonella enterica subsp. enterica serovar Anatum]
SYIEPFVERVAGLSGNVVTLFLLVFGGAGIIGSLLFSLVHRFNPHLFVVGAVFLLGACLALMLPLSGAESYLVGLSVFWGM